MSSSPNLDDTATYVTSFDEASQAPLAPNATYTDNESISLPPSGTGPQYLILVTNIGGLTTDEFYTNDNQSIQGETNDANNTYAAPIALSAPDLAVTTATAPTSAIQNGSINVSWTVKNDGSVTAPGNWSDGIYVSSSPTLDFNSDNFEFVASFDESKQSPLVPGASYTDSESISLPADAGTGSEYLFFVTNSDAVLATLGGQGETNYTNNTFAAPIAVSAPDLTVTTASAPTSTIVGTSINVSWNVKNIGSVGAPGNWEDAVYVGASPNFDAAADTFINSFSASQQSSLAAGASYMDHESITLPPDAGLPVPGTWIFVTNEQAVAGELFDNSEAQGETTATANNTYSVPITVQAPRPDDHDGFGTILNDPRRRDERLLDREKHRQA